MHCYILEWAAIVVSSCLLIVIVLICLPVFLSLVSCLSPVYLPSCPHVCLPECLVV